MAPATWFGDGWYLINLVYFRLLAASMSIFGTGVAGTRTLSAFAGTGFVAVVAWIGCRHFGWRTGLLATALATTGALYVQQSRFIGESGLTALLCAISLAGFLEGGRTGHAWAFAVAGLGGGLSLYFYPSGRLWVVGAAVTVVILFLTQPRPNRPLLARGVIVAAAAALIAVAPFLVHLESNPQVLTTRYDETSVLDPRNQGRLTYLNPPVPTLEVLALQFERTLGMFDRYPDGVSFLPTSRPAMPSPLGALTIIGIFLVTIRSIRDPRYATISVWFAIGIAGVFLTVETPDFLRASSALVTFPLYAAILLDNLANRIDWLASTARDHLPATDFARSQPIGASIIGAIALAALVGQAYLYFQVYPPLMAPSWSYATQEGIQIDRLGQTGPVAGLDMFEFQVDSGWVRFLAQGVTIDRLPNPGAQTPILYTEESSPDDAASSLRKRPDQSLSFMLYPDPNQSAFVGFLAGLYPEGKLGTPIDGRRAFVVPATAVA
ncbi:MAG TPA: glycosyltransferase family 39 protein, partial [Chloroflexota bacterium]|nr:glycosyltransferase family 39 protein [Chloroflexota bacterium]